MLGSLRHLSLVRAYLFTPKLRRLAGALREQDPRTDLFKTMWDTNVGALLSRRMFREVDMDGVQKYAYKPNLRKLSFLATAGGMPWKMEVVDTPGMRDVLRDIDTTLLVSASYDEHGFRHVDSELADDCQRHVLFLGDSFTDGLWVSDGDTFANVYGRLARDRSGLRVCPVNAGVNGYGSFEERFVLEHEFDHAGRPSLIFVMYFPNDVDQDYDAVVRGTMTDVERLWEASLSELRRMHRFAVEHGSTLVLAAIPPAEQSFDRAPQTHYQDVLRAFAAQEGVMFINVYEGFVAHDPHPLYWPWDPHLTPAGHRAVAELLYNATKDMLQ
jgi:lysophospholipase L1-like esterase